MGLSARHPPVDNLLKATPASADCTEIGSEAHG